MRSCICDCACGVSNIIKIDKAQYWKIGEEQICKIKIEMTIKIKLTCYTACQN